MMEEIAFENGRIFNFQGLVTLTLDRVILHTIMHHSSTSTYMPNFIEIEETFCGRTDVRTFETHFIRSTRRSPPNKQTIYIVLKSTNKSGCITTSQPILGNRLLNMAYSTCIRGRTDQWTFETVFITSTLSKSRRKKTEFDVVAVVTTQINKNKENKYTCIYIYIYSVAYAGFDREGCQN